ncbi:hypothetical protein R1sor_008421 [Riccia sorocarpa]|uniref:Cytochrome P450 n=1 Tax=Riccia sorocarpa TaxID=122646 RepID=A0ABD3HTB3_9MARC
MELSGPKWTWSRDEYVGVCIAGVLFLVWLFWEFYDDRRIPKGSLGYVPYFGETLEFLECPVQYTERRLKKYGKLFKGAFMGIRAVVSTDPEFSYARDTHGHDSFKISLPRSLRVMLGDTYNMSAEKAGLQKLVHGILNSEGLKSLVKYIDAIILQSLAQWEGKTVRVSTACKKITRTVLLYITLGNDPAEGKIHDQIFNLIPIVTRAAVAVPIYFPGTKFYTGYQARLKIEKLIGRLVRRRTKASLEKPFGDSQNILDELVRYKNSEGEPLNLKQICDVLCMLFFEAENPTAAAMTYTIKELSDHLIVRQAVMAECEAVEARRFFPGLLTLAEVRNMRYIQNMLKETLRRYSIVPSTVREAKEDVEIRGTLVPRGWFAVTMASNMHMNPEIWEEPDQYNPKRFQDSSPKPKNFTPFGVGPHMCPGKSLAEVMVSIFFYHLLHKYEWKLEGKFIGLKIEYGGFLPKPVVKEEVRITLNRRTRKIKKSVSVRRRPPPIWDMDECKI